MFRVLYIFLSFECLYLFDKIAATQILNHSVYIMCILSSYTNIVCIYYYTFNTQTHSEV